LLALLLASAVLHERARQAAAAGDVNSALMSSAQQTGEKQQVG
jgi:hypothetical protein